MICLNFRLTFLIVLCLGFSGSILAQDYDEKIIYQNKVYQPECSWITLGGGLGFQTKLKDTEKNIAMDVNFRVKHQYFTVGYHFTSDEMVYKRSMQRFTDLHAGIGIRREDTRQNVYFYGGPSSSYGYVYDYTNAVGDKFYKGFNTLGFYSEFQYTYKIFYDIGIGTAFYASINPYYKVVGARLFMYFSTSYRNKLDFIKIQEK